MNSEIIYKIDKYLIEMGIPNDPISIASEIEDMEDKVSIPHGRQFAEIMYKFTKHVDPKQQMSTYERLTNLPITRLRSLYKELIKLRYVE